MKHTIKGYITSSQFDWQDGATISFQTYKPSAEYSPECVVVREHSIEVDVPDDFDPRPGMVAALEEQREAVRKKFAEEMMTIDRRISQLLAIENTAGEAFADMEAS